MILKKAVLRNPRLMNDQKQAKTVILITKFLCNIENV